MSFRPESALMQLILWEPRSGSLLAVGWHGRCRDGQGAASAPATGHSGCCQPGAQPAAPPCPAREQGHRGAARCQPKGTSGRFARPAPPGPAEPGRAGPCPRGCRCLGTAAQLMLPLIMRRERRVKPWLFDYPALSHDAARWLVQGNEITFQ